MTLFERAKVSDWRLEIFTVGFCILFVVLYKGGDLYNNRKVNGFLNGVRGVFEENFFQFGVSEKSLYVKDSAENYSSYATGRENVSRVDIAVKLVPRQNAFLWIMESLFGYFTASVQPPQDRVDIVIHPYAQYENFVTAISSKLGMGDFRKFNYYLSLTRTVDSDELPPLFVFMSEVKEIQEKTFTQRLQQALTADMASFVRFVAFTDQPVERPTEVRDLMPYKRVVISTQLVTGKAELAKLSELVAAVLEVVDKLASGDIAMSAEAARKIVKAREAEIAKFEKAAKELAKERALEEKQKAKRDERSRQNLTRDEQLKAEKRAQERKQRRAQKKMTVRG